MTLLLLAALAFVGSHFLLSHPLRRPIVGIVGEAAFGGIYSVVALATLIWMAQAYKGAPQTDLLWPVGDGLWAAATIVMLIAAILLMGSVVGNPALPTGGATPKFPDTARGVFAITRHPMMWSFALWGACHIAVYPMMRNIVVTVAIIVLALVGAALQDRKKRGQEPVLWPAWQAKTSYLPFAAIAGGKSRLGGFRGHALLGGVVLWLAATWAHIPLAGWAAGIWRWV